MNILNLADQYEYEAALFMFKYVNNRLPLSFDHAFQFKHEVQTSHQTRQSSQMQVIRCNSNFAQKHYHCSPFQLYGINVINS